MSNSTVMKHVMTAAVVVNVLLVVVNLIMIPISSRPFLHVALAIVAGVVIVGCIGVRGMWVAEDGGSAK